MKNVKKYKWLVVGTMAAAVLLLGGCSGSNGASGKTTKTTAKTVSFVEEAKGKGTYVWVQAAANENDGFQISKDDTVNEIYVLDNGKIVCYQIQDPDVTLGSVSKLSDKETIALAKKQDKKYFDISSKEVQNFIDGDDSTNRVGQQNDLWGDENIKNLLYGWGTLHYLGDKGSEKRNGVDYVTFSNVKIITPEADEKMQHLSDDDADENAPFGMLSEFSYLMKPISEDNAVITKYMGEGLLANMKEVKYHAPKKQKLTDYKETTDNTGNTIESQSISYQAIDYFEPTPFEENVYQAFKDDSVMTEYAELVANGGLDYKPEEAKKLADQIFTEKTAKTLTKGVFDYYTWSKTLTLGASADQTIYDSRYIGYAINSDPGAVPENYLLTKAQVDGQEAVLRNK
ncbi:hypothetical protein [Enterococcus songbeiensis]|uniref:hypothetical protein n=1 Tax=Enterococcus songbeiensis TaxID=2559927 RepID=UPI0010F894AE|nr:hypothetical protein [Enterococcus songbeiensis]